MAKTKNKKGYNSEVDVKTSTINLLLNIIIFFLVALIIYLAYSVFIKLTGLEKSDPVSGPKGTASAIIQVEVLNGCGVSGIADRFTDYLRNENFDVVKTDNYLSFDVTESLVIERLGNMANARKVAKSLGISEKNIIQQLNDDYFLDVSIVIGKDYYRLLPLKTGN
ncbi:LytR C-terminal domain-containing protein [Bacteroidota bacterium]